MKKFISVLLMVIVVVLIVNVFPNKDDVTPGDDKEARNDRVVAVLQTAWDKFGLFSYGIEGVDMEGVIPTIWIGMDETKSELELRGFLEESIDKTDLRHYDIEVFKKDIRELEKKNLLKFQNQSI